MKNALLALMLILTASSTWAWREAESRHAALLADLDASEILVRAVDGDTVEPSSRGKARLLGVDTPETWEKTGGKWHRIENPDPRGVAAYEYLRSLEGRRVRVQFEKQRRDRYGRPLVHLYLLPAGPDIASELLRRGLGEVMAIRPNTRRYGDWKTARPVIKPVIKEPEKAFHGAL